MISETTRTRIERDALHRYSKYEEGLYKDNCVSCYIAGATAEAERSAAWKAEATLLINKIHDWAEGDKTLPLGHSVFDEAVKRLKVYDELREKAQRLADALEKIIEWVNDTGMKNVAIDDKLGMALYHSKHLALNALQQWRGEK